MTGAACRKASVHAVLCMLFACLAAALAPAAHADTVVTLYESFAGNVNFVMTGGTLRTQSNNGNACAVGATSNATLSGIPVGASVRKAYLYYAASGSTVDANVTFDGNNITADRTFTATFDNAGTDFDFYSGFKDVTAFVSGNGNYSFSNLSISTGNPWCASAAVVGGWSLIVIYEEANEDLRVINVFDGFQTFRGQSIELTPSNFQIPVSPINGKHGVITWEGDVENSDPLGGETEDITFNGVDLVDAMNPIGEQFNSTINTLGSSTTYGVDVDTYDVSSLLSAGQLSATTVYSSGADLVILSAEVMSVTNVPVSDLSITKTHSGDFMVGQNGVYTLEVSNAGPNNSSGTTTVSDTLPAGLSFVSATGTGWTCGAAGQDVTCTRAASIASGASAPPITLTVAVGGAAFPAVTNTASVTGGNFDNHAENDSASDNTDVLAPDLSTSTKSVTDLDGGDALPGDTLRYTVTLTETGGVTATNVAVTDDMPALVEGFSVVSIPGGATDASTAFGGVNGNGYLDVSGITVPANGSVEIVFDVTIEASASAGSQIENTATVTLSGGAGANPAAPTVTIAASSLPQSGNKLLYLYSAPNDMSRVPPAGTEGEVQMGGGSDEPEFFTLTPSAAAPIEVVSPPTVNLYVYESGQQSYRSGEVRLYRASSPGTYFSQTFGQNLSANAGAPTLLNLTLDGGTANAPLVLAPGDEWVLRVLNTTGQNSRQIRLLPNPNGNNSTVELDVSTVINVDSLEDYSTPYPGTTQPSLYGGNQTVYLRAVVSDPFGSADITAANITITDADGAVVANGAAMSVVASDALTKTYEYAQAISQTGPSGNWNVDVVAHEGTEGTISDNQLGAFTVLVVPVPDLSGSTKTVVDMNGGEAEPGDVLRYTITLNESEGVAASNVSVTDDMPALVTAFSVVSIPAGATDASTSAGTGANGNGFLDVNDIAVPANGSVEIVFDVTIDNAVTAGSTIDNTATVTPPGAGIGASPAAPTVTVQPSAVPQSGNKLLYLYSAPNGMSRVPPPGAQANLLLNDNDIETFTMTPAAAASMEIASAPTVDLWLYRSGSGWAGFISNRSVDVRLYRASNPGTVFSGSASSNAWSNNAATPTLVTVTLDGGASAPLTLAGGDTWVLEVENTSGNIFGDSMDVNIAPKPAGGNSAVHLESNNVINVDSVSAYGTAWPTATVPPYFSGGDTVHVRAIVSDPFGSFDITAATITIEDALGNVLVSGDAMTMVSDSGAATKTYEYPFVVPAGGPAGNWTATVTAAEGTEGTIEDAGVGAFSVVLLPSLGMTKFVQVLSDPINGTTNPKAIPGAVSAYSITITNSGLGMADAGSVVIRTAIPAGTSMFVDDSGGDPMSFIDAGSGMTFTYATDVAYSSQPGGGAPFNYVPVPDAEGYDANVTGIQVTPGGGDLNASSGAPHPGFTLRFKVRIE